MLGIILMAWQGISLLALKKSSPFIYVCCAVILFVVSDSILAIDKFKMSIPYANIIIGVTYWSSITLLSLSITPIFYARNRT
jgi:predicted tellurium resistance membrane protein TerC